MDLLLRPWQLEAKLSQLIRGESGEEHLWNSSNGTREFEGRSESEAQVVMVALGLLIIKAMNGAMPGKSSSCKSLACGANDAEATSEPSLDETGIGVRGGMRHGGWLAEYMFGQR
jgi:hypothetical protein